jgi:hypothetical protein
MHLHCRTFCTSICCSHRPISAPHQTKREKEKEKLNREMKRKKQVGGKIVGEIREAFGIRSTQRSKRWWILD